MSPKKQIVLLLIAVFVSGIGLGITLPVLPFYAERLMGLSPVTRAQMPVHVTGLVSVYALMQFLFAPLWGAWSDRVGRKRLICIGIAGAAIGQILFALSTSLLWLYGAQILGGFLSASLSPVATAFVADLSTDEDRSTHMAWLGTVSSLASVAGIAFGGAVTFADFHLRLPFAHLKIEAFSMPFVASALLMAVTAVVVWKWLPESVHHGGTALQKSSNTWRELAAGLGWLLALAAFGQVALTAFESTFPLFAQRKFGSGPREVGLAFMVCGLVMAVFQVVAIGVAARRIRSSMQLSLGFALMGVGILLLLAAPVAGWMFGAIGVLSLGMAFIAPNLSALSATGRGAKTGAAMGLLSAANNLGQVGGPLIGGALFAWKIQAPYFLSGILMVLLALGIFAARNAFGKPIPRHSAPAR